MGDRKPGLGEKTGTWFLRTAPWGAIFLLPFEYLSHVIVTKGHSSDEEIGPETVVAELRFPQGSPDATAQVFLAPGSFPNGQAGGAGERFRVAWSGKRGDRLDGREWMLGTAKQDLSRARGGRQGCGCGDQCEEGPHRPVAPVTQAPALPAPFCHSEAQLSPSCSPAPSSPFSPSTDFSKGKKRESRSSP